jgi:hypothetical protein
MVPNPFPSAPHKNAYEQDTHTLVWDEAITSDGVSLQSLINKHATVLRHIEIRHGLWWS